MRVLLAHKFFHLTGGAEVFFFETGRVLEQHGHEVAYFSTIDERNRPSKYAKYFVKPPAYRGVSNLRRALDFPKTVYSRQAKRKFANLLQDFQPDIVHLFHIHVHLSPSILHACRDAGIPVVMSTNDYKLICTNYKLYHHGKICEDCKGGRLYMPVVNRCCQRSLAFSLGSSIEAYAHRALDIYRRNVHTFLFASRFMASKTEEFWGVDAFRWKLLENPFDATAYSPSGEHDDYFLFFGRLIAEKGVETLVRAMGYLPPHMRLVIVGDGPLGDELRESVKSRGFANVEFVGPKWGDELVPYLRRARFVVVPSAWHENFPYVILQAFASGKAVVGSERGGIPELIRHGVFGLTYPADQPKVLAECIQELYDNPEGTLAMGKAARAYVEDEFNDERFYQTLVNIYEGILS